MYIFVNHVTTTEPINMGLRPYDAKSFLDGHSYVFFLFFLYFLFCIPYTLPHFILDLSLDDIKRVYSLLVGEFTI